MFPISLRSSKSDRSLRKLKKGRSNLSWSIRSSKAQFAKPEVDFAAFHSGLPFPDDHILLDSPSLSRRSRCISIRDAKRDTILIDLTNNDLLPALDYAFAILDADGLPARSLPPSPPPKTLSSDSSSTSSTMPCTPSSSTFSASPLGTSLRSAPPRYVYVPSPLSGSSGQSSLPRTQVPSRPWDGSVMTPHDGVFDPHELSRALSHAQHGATSGILSSPPEPLSAPPVPFPPPATPPAARIPLLQRKPRLLHSAESSIDGHEYFMPHSYPGSSKVSLTRSLSSLGHHRDVFGLRGACPSSTSVNTIDSGLSALLARQPASHGPSSLKLFSSPKKFRQPIPTRRASTPPPSRTRLGIPARPPVRTLPDFFLLGPAARREAAYDSNYLSQSRT